MARFFSSVFVAFCVAYKQNRSIVLFVANAITHSVYLVSTFIATETPAYRINYTGRSERHIAAAVAREEKELGSDWRVDVVREPVKRT